MSTHIESIMRCSASTMNGWMKTTTPENMILRSIRIGSQRNCNEDGLICDTTTAGKIKDLLKKHNIDDYELCNINNSYEYSTQLLLNEDNYSKLVQSISVVKS